MASDDEQRLVLTALPADVLGAIYDACAPVDCVHLASTCTILRVHGLSERCWQPRLERLRASRMCLRFGLSSEDLPLRPGGSYPGGPGWLGHHPAGLSFCESSAFSFFKATLDSTRTALTLDELSSFEWCFRFKAAAGETWISNDPWWRGSTPISLKLCCDGTVRALKDARPFWGEAGSISGRWQLEPGAWCSRSLPPEARAPDRAAVVTMNGHPSYTVRRHPRHGGIFLESCWAVWTSFPMAPRGVDLVMEDALLRIHADDARQQREVVAYNRAMSGLGADFDL